MTDKDDAPKNPQPLPSTSSASGLLQRTGVTEGFYRRAWAAPHSSPRSGGGTSSPRGISRAFFGGGHAATTDEHAAPVTTGSLKAPGELGQAIPHSDSQVSESNRRTTKNIVCDQKTLRQRKSIDASIRRSLDPAVALANVDQIRTWAAAKPQEPSLVTSFAYQGMQVLFASTSTSSTSSTDSGSSTSDNRTSVPVVFGMCSNTHYVFQQLPLSSEAKIVTLLSDAMTGRIVVAHTDGTVQVFGPVPTEVKHTAFGRYRWHPLTTIHSAKVLCNGGSVGIDDKLVVSISNDGKVLVALRDQVAVWEAKNTNSTSSENGAELLWMTRLPAPVETAQLSGDGQAIALVLKQNDEEDALDGVHTFERDWDDGSDMDRSTSSLGRRPSSLQRQATVGILYKPGPFLVHTAPVTRLSFRGLGHNTSSWRNDKNSEEQGNDLLLTYSASNCTARIFGQNAWRPLTEWKTPPSTRVDWVKGVSAFTLGDLESQKKPAQPKSAGSSRRPSAANSVSSGDDSSAYSAALNETLGKRNHFHSIPSHSAPSSNAGAWVTEVTFQGDFPALRLSRLTYLKRGVDDLNPTLFEIVSAFLPAGSILGDRILTNDAGLSVEAIWPAWNPWLSETSDMVDSHETLRGSAMAFLGLSSGPGMTATGGFFGDSLLGSTQSPPAEIRIAASHPLTGQVVVLDMPLFGDRYLSSLELGSPQRYVLSLKDMVSTESSSHMGHLSTRRSASMDYETSRLVARITEDSKTISVTWRRPGTMSLLPANWEPDDVNPANAAHLLSENSRLVDDSLVPMPLALPPLCLPLNLESVQENESIRSVLWWPDETFGGSRLLLAMLDSGTMIVFEVAPPWSFLEPKLPASLGSMTGMGSRNYSIPDFINSEEEEKDNDGKEYDVLIPPDPEYGLGLRLESQFDGMPAVAGSFKKHPLTGESLPAEKTGMICLGDELVSANGLNLEEKTFDDIIGAVRELGSTCGPGNPMRMRFRQVPTRQRRADSAASGNVVPEAIHYPGRRTMEEMIGVSPEELQRKQSMGNSDQSRSQKTNETTGEVRDALVVNRNKENVSSVVGIFPGVVPDYESGGRLPLLVLVPFGHESGGSQRTALLFLAEGISVRVALLGLAPDGSPDKSTMSELGSFDLLDNDPSDSQDVFVLAMEVVEPAIENCCLAVCDNRGRVRLAFVKIKTDEASSTPSLSFQSFEAFRLNDPCPSSLLLRGYSVGTLATMCPDSDGACRQIIIWTARPHPGCPLNRIASTSNPDEAVYSEYAAVEVRIESNFRGSGSRENTVVDFSFLRSGRLDASPSLLAFTLKGLVLYQSQGDSPGWVPTFQISYGDAGSAVATGASTVSSSEQLSKERDTSARDLFPHLIPALQSNLSSHDETNYLQADWHPDSLLARICTDARGVKVALRRHVRDLFLWLCSEGRDISEDHLQGPLLVAPFSILETNEDSEESEDEQPEMAASIMTSLSSAAVQSSNSLGAEEDDQLRKLQMSLSKKLSIAAPDVSQTAANLVSPTSRQDGQSQEMELPPVLNSMKKEDLLILWALCGLVLDPPNFKSLDICGQLFSFSSVLFYKLKTVQFTEAVQTRRSPRIMPTLLQKRSSSSFHSNQNDSFTPFVASAGCLSALLSHPQNSLLASCHQPGEKLDWESARELRIPFWVRSDATLARLSEEIGQSAFQKKRDIMECALFFVVAKKMRTLTNLAATDHTDSGRKFFKFLTTHDFSSERGRRAAEKNAFSLLRKCRYGVASSFFLLADPPFLKSALETIVTKMQDLDLAFLVARLMETGGNAGAQPGGLGSSLGGFGVLGGGGGYAATHGSQSSSMFDNEISTKDWKPRLGTITKKLLVERMLPSCRDDRVMMTVQLLWLDKKEEAWWWLSGAVKASYGFETVYEVVDAIAPGVFSGSGGEGKLRLSYRALNKANSLVDFISSPIILKTVKANARVRFASSLIVCGALTARGVEATSIRSILEYADPLDLEEKENVSHKSQTRSNGSQNNGIESSSAFAGPPHAKPVNSNEAAASSIFDSYEVPAPRPEPSQPPPEAASSIFADFDPPPQKKPSGGDAQSSIFDSFDVAPPKQKAPGVAATTKDVSQSGAMQSSIFDTFDAPPQAQPPSIASPPQDPMNSSIFDSFDGPPQPKGDKTTKTATPVATKVVDASSPDEEIEEDATEQLLTIRKTATPELWVEWRRDALLTASARRVLRELASVLAQIHGDPSGPSIEDFYRREDPLIPSGASEVLQLHCDAESIVGRVKQTLDEVCDASALSESLVVDTALRLLGSSFQHYRVLFSVVLLSASGEGHKAEDNVRAAAVEVIQRCQVFAFSYDDIVHQRRTRFHVSSQFVRREAARLSWQLETCLWLHRGGGLRLSGLALKEAIIAVRLGLLMAAWNRNYECLEAMIRSVPDCHVDEEAGRHFWTSLKIMTPIGENLSKSRKTNSGGWEFLVDCRRSEATELLRDRPTGCFIIRPHAEDHSVFTLSFKTNLVPTAEEQQKVENGTPETSGDELEQSDVNTRNGAAQQPSKKVKKDDVVQHAIIRLSDAGFRCGSFGPFTLIGLLEAVSSSLPFKLRFDKPPTNRVIKEEGSQPSPNAVFLRKLALSHADSLTSNPPMYGVNAQDASIQNVFRTKAHEGTDASSDRTNEDGMTAFELQSSVGLFLELLVLSIIRKQLSGVAAVEYDDSEESWEKDNDGQSKGDESAGRSVGTRAIGPVDAYTVASRILRPLLTWCHSLEVRAVDELAPGLKHLAEATAAAPVDLTESAEAIEAAPNAGVSSADGGDAVLRRMIQRGSGVEFSTLRLTDGGECTVVVLFSKNEAVQWLLSSGSEDSEADAVARLETMENKRVIEAIDLTRLHLKMKGPGIEEKGIRYRFVDPWEVEALDSKEAETRSATLGRSSFLAFSLAKAALSSESLFRSMGGLPLLELWTASKGGLALTKALASVHPPWERGASGDLQVTDGVVTEPPPFSNCIRQHLYRNALFRRLDMPQRFLALVQVELLDLKNLISPGGSLSLSVYALLRLKRSGSGSTLTNKARTLDTASTHPVKLGRSSGPGPVAPASWGSVVRFRFPLPEDVAIDGSSYDGDREILFKGPPSVLQVTVYEKKLLVDHSLGTADIRTDGLWAGDQLEEWVPLRSEKHGITWFARIRLTLRFELMCLASKDDASDVSLAAPSVGLARIEQLSKAGGSAHEDLQKRSMSSPDLLTYFESMVY